MSRPHPSQSKRMIDRRSVLRGAAAGLAGAIAGVEPLRAQSGDENLLNQLIAMDDLELRKAVGTTFIQYLKCAPPIKATFFPDATAPDIKYDPRFTLGSSDPLVNAGYPLAEALIVWALANTSEYGFNKTANGPSAAKVVRTFCILDSGKGAVEHVADILYTSMFPQYVKSDGTTFAFFLDPGKRDHFTDLLAETLISDDFFNKAMARKKADPSNFPQYVYMQLFKISALIGYNNHVSDDPRYKNALNKWLPFINRQHWTKYQYLTIDKFSEQTFMPEVQAAITMPTVVSHHSGGTFCAGGSNARCHTDQIPDYNHGLGVEGWLLGPHVDASLFNRVAPDNKK
ncbi:hypothetical protein IC762_28100 [Bradyrhizobium genosp. L]|uniref:hypothetical protein n=1 Tax=Bradyrhizobium genosp. L TaxID=83637 RepID=UPI0018A2B656|nr:hypothetical protein [Bradyrhizobium genosp. L]QPF83536.1 hypothetical protein IC762_28100 [Bradyrhizobium genosp. L]